MLTYGDILAALTEYDRASNTTPISAVAIDSREVKNGALFVAFRGESADGHDYVKQAFQNGAAIALVEREIDGYRHIEAGKPIPSDLTGPFCILVQNTERGLQQIAADWRQRFPQLDIIGITGSVGKTSTKELTHGVLSFRYPNTHKTPKNYNNEIGLPLTVLQLHKDHTHAVLEMGMYAKGEIALLCDIAHPKIGVVTNIGPVHMSRLGSLEAIVEAKRELVEALPAASEGGVAILNRDDEQVMSMAPHTRARIFTYGLSREADLWADQVISRGLEGIKFVLHYQGLDWRVRVPLLGSHSVHTALRATAVGLACGMEMSDIVRGLQNTQNQMRLVTVRGPQNSLIIDDTYNASPDSVIAALNLLGDIRGRKIAVLGDMLELGRAEKEGHQRVGRRAVEIADILVSVGQLGKIIGEEALSVGMARDRVHILPNNQNAADLLETLIQSEDVVLIKGSLGARMEEIVAQLSRSKGQV